MPETQLQDGDRVYFTQDVLTDAHGKLEYGTTGTVLKSSRGERLAVFLDEGDTVTPIHTVIIEKVPSDDTNAGQADRVDVLTVVHEITDITYPIRELLDSMAHHFKDGDRVQLTHDATTLDGVALKRGEAGKLYLWSAPDRLGVYFDRKIHDVSYLTPPIFDVLYEGEKVDILTLCKPVTDYRAARGVLADDTPPVAQPQELMEHYKSEAERWKAEHDIELARRQEAEKKLETAERNWAVFLTRLDIITEMIAVPMDVNMTHAMRNGADTIWHSLLKQLLNRYTIKSTRQEFTTPPDVEDLPF